MKKRITTGDQVLAALNKGGPMTITQIAQAIGRPAATVSWWLNKFECVRQVVRIKTCYPCRYSTNHADFVDDKCRMDSATAVCIRRAVGEWEHMPHRMACPASVFQLGGGA